MMNKRIFLFFPILIALGMLLWLLISGEREASGIREQVVRYHVVANSDSKEDQEIKILLRDRLFEEIQALFSNCNDGQEALDAAEENRERLQKRGEEILRELGSNASVTVAIGTRYFPTKSYESLSFPAGKYRAVSILIGAGKGENFWCVLYPALCLSPAVCREEGEEKMAVAVGEEGLSFLQKEGEIRKIKFQLVEWFEVFRQKFENS